MPQHPGNLGWIEPKDRTKEQNDGHADAMSKMVNFALPDPTGGSPVKVVLTDYWKDPDVVADLGLEFSGYHQNTGSCFRAGVPVRMADGSEKPVEDVSVGDEVVTHHGRCRKVVEVMTRAYTGDMFTLHVTGFGFPLEMTADHHVAVMVGEDLFWKRADCVDVGDKVVLGWGKDETAPPTIDTRLLLGDDVIVLDDLMKDNAYTKGNEPIVPVGNIGSARNIIRKSGIDWSGRVKKKKTKAENSILRHIPVGPSFARLMGLYLAEGGCDAGRVTFTLNAKETNIAGEIQSLIRGLFGVEGGEIVHSEDRPNTINLRFSNLNLATVIKSLVPGNIYTKRIPGIFFTADEPTRLALLLGWMAGDGHVAIKKTDKNVRLTGVSASLGLARDMTTLALSCGVRATTRRRKPHKRSKAAYDVDLSGSKAVGLFSAVAYRATGARYKTTDRNVTDYGYARSVKKITTTAVERLPVFDFEVEEDHSFIAGGVVVHNCVGVSAGNAIVTLSAIQRKLADAPTKALLVWWGYAYGRTRYNEGDRGQGEGAVDSIMGQTLIKEGVLDAATPGLPKFDTSDGLSISSNLEYQWSDGGSSVVTKWADQAKVHPLGAAAPLYDTQSIKAAICNGYPVLDGCSYYVGNGHVTGSGSNSYVTGKYDGRGGHSTCVLGFWDHPNDGPLFLYSNQWPSSTYPKDPAGAGRCCVWLPESEMAKLFRNGGGDGETMALSHLTSFPSQPAVLDWSKI